MLLKRRKQAGGIKTKQKNRQKKKVASVDKNIIIV